MTQRCSDCSSRVGCIHTSEIPKKWADEQLLETVSLGTKLTDITDPEAILNGLKSNNDMVNKIMSTQTSNYFIKCNFCDIEVKPQFLNKHILVHIDSNYLEESDSNSYRQPIKETSTIVNNPIVVKEDFVEVKKEDIEAFANTLPLSKIKDIEEFSYRKIKDVSAFAGTSRDGRYSDFTILVWFSDSFVSCNTGYLGGSNSNYSKSSDRLHLHLAYDSLEHYYTISGKIYRRSGYSDNDTEEGTTPNRICDQDQLMLEIKKILLYFRIPPRGAYKRFIKAMRMGHSFAGEEGNRSQASTVNHFAIVEELKKSKNAAFSRVDDNYYGHC